ncbi:hypothetical protein [Lysobacter firmicutimachus]|uniref:Uncharacterized protein n=1 Tax=Lysobacter firmicutimachus TaxID=1792846 RepID=A0ABU8D2C3_9GAMM
MNTLQIELRAATAAQHTRLDRLMAGGLSDHMGYARYLRGMAALVSILALAPEELSARALWRPGSMASARPC